MDAAGKLSEEIKMRKLLAVALLVIVLLPAQAQKKVEPRPNGGSCNSSDKLEFNRLRFAVINQEQQLWLWKHPTKTLPQNPCLDADLKETCSAMKER